MLHLQQAYVGNGYKSEWGMKENPHETKIPHERERSAGWGPERTGSQGRSRESSPRLSKGEPIIDNEPLLGL